jgi:hypothetical protein
MVIRISERQTNIVIAFQFKYLFRLQVRVKPQGAVVLVLNQDHRPGPKLFTVTGCQHPGFDIFDQIPDFLLVLWAGHKLLSFKSSFGIRIKSTNPVADKHL